MYIFAQAFSISGFELQPARRETVVGGAVIASDRLRCTVSMEIVFTLRSALGQLCEFHASVLCYDFSDEQLKGK